MSWISYLILAYISVALQVGASRGMEWHGAGPDFVLIAAIFIALNARRETALLGCFILGFLHDLSGQGPPGLFAFSYALASLLIIPMQRALKRDHPLSHVMATLFAGVLTAAMILLHRALRPEPAGIIAARQSATAQGPPIHLPLAPVLYTVLYTTLLAPLLLWLLQKCRVAFNFQGSRGRIMAARRL